MGLVSSNGLERYKVFLLTKPPVISCRCSVRLLQFFWAGTNCMRGSYSKSFCVSSCQSQWVA